jgi:hypothetical protein
LRRRRLIVIMRQSTGCADALVTDSSERPAEECDTRKLRDMRPALRASLALDVIARLTIWGAALALSLAAFHTLDAWPQTGPTHADLLLAVRWAARLAWFVLLFNVVYVGLLVLLRLLIPTPR